MHCFIADKMIGDTIGTLKNYLRKKKNGFLLLILLITRNAIALIKGLISERSFWKEFIDKRAISGCFSA